jgi:antibiotic biosynthesis monooxygenase (ABM) superfamily enzyme
MNQPIPPKKWKFALLVWLFIYPVVTILSIVLLPLLNEFHPALKTLIMSVVLVFIMAWMYIPFINKRFFVWLRK